MWIGTGGFPCVLSSDRKENAGRYGQWTSPVPFRQPVIRKRENGCNVKAFLQIKHLPSPEETLCSPATGPGFVSHPEFLEAIWNAAAHHSALWLLVPSCLEQDSHTFLPDLFEDSII